MTHSYLLTAYGSVAAGRDFWARNVQKVQHVGTSGDFIFQANHFLSTPTFKTQVVHGREWKKICEKNIFRNFKYHLLFLHFFTIFKKCTNFSLKISDF